MIHYYFLSLSLASPSSRSFLDSKAHAFFCKLDKAFFNRLDRFLRQTAQVREDQGAPEGQAQHEWLSYLKTHVKIKILFFFMRDE